MKRLLKTILAITMIGMFTLGLGACSKDDPVKKTGKKLEKAFDEAKKKVGKAVD